ncbi:hypothetical protein T4D_11024 [Trichinella pseudospiralis]|uniref:Uncharacterized protein n=1 Tax=Trichinella pseudospiralis TaxID=6337 RepID=A0A0V1DQF5_TRIPS|nr:hypothetical protein T4D_11024 [Trichinella pseudospiralis]
MPFNELRLSLSLKITKSEAERHNIYNKKRSRTT